MKKLFSTILTIVLTGFAAMAQQQKTVTGTVISGQDHEPLVGATVIVVGTQTGAATDVDGRFSFEVPASAKELKVSYVGFETRTVAIDFAQPMTIALTDMAHSLDDVIVVAYGTAKKSEYTGSASVVT
ncbi:MAG: carboxypeptidase-like regulatory domain-containing protein, partial [Muribaculaceae bacterium]|nr:carboxypeptidase-like regulatory domain-containing protein [Muribaculaceae bacterium]